MLNPSFDLELYLMEVHFGHPQLSIILILGSVEFLVPKLNLFLKLLLLNKILIHPLNLALPLSLTINSLSLSLTLNILQNRFNIIEYPDTIASVQIHRLNNPYVFISITTWIQILLILFFRMLLDIELLIQLLEPIMIILIIDIHYQGDWDHTVQVLNVPWVTVVS